MNHHDPAELTRTRKVLFTFVLLAVFPLILVFFLELGLHLTGYGVSSGFFIEKEINGQAVFTENNKFTWQFFPPHLARPSCHLTVPGAKKPGTMRLFVLGGSAAMGDPDFSFGFSRILEKMLQYQYPDTRFEVINVSITAINSHVVLPIIRDCEKLQPDLFILYLGNNEIIGPYGPSTVFSPFSSSLGFIRFQVFLNATRTGQLLKNIGRRFRRQSDDLPAWQGVDMFMENRLRMRDKRTEAAYDHFQKNLEDICEIGARSGTGMILSTIATNLKDCAPFGSLHRLGLPDKLLQEWQACYDAGIHAESMGLLDDAVESYIKAAGSDYEFADQHFRLARCYQALDQFDTALFHFTEARDLDALRFRADTRINELIRKCAADEKYRNMILIDAEKDFQNSSDHGLPGSRLFYDHVHMNFKGNYLLARLIKDRIEKRLQLESRNPELSETECAERLAFTMVDRHRIEREILGRMKSPAFANRLDNRELVEQLQMKLDGLKSEMNPDAFTEAKASYQRAIELDNQDWVLHSNFGLLLLEAGDPAGAAEQFHFVLQRIPDDYLSYNNLGLAFVQLGKPERAVESYRHALRIKPEFLKAHFNLAEALERQHNFEEAIRHYREARLSGEKLAGVYNRYGKWLADRSFYEKALNQFETALYLCPDLPEVRNNIGIILCNQMQLESAIAYFQQEIEHNPDFLPARNHLAGALSHLGRYEDAVSQLELLLEADPDNPNVQNNIGSVLLKMGQVEQAIVHFKTALQIDPGLPSAQHNLNYAMNKLHRTG